MPRAPVPASVLPDRFEAGGLVVRRWEVDDAPALHEAITSSIEHLRPWMAWISFEPQTVEQRAELITTWSREWRAGGDVVLGAFLDGVAIGGTGLHRRIGPDGIEIGYWVRRDHIGRGLAGRVAALLTTGALALDSLTHVEIHCDEANVASRRVPERLGFRHIGTVDRPISAPAETGSHRVYRMTRDEWSARGDAHDPRA